MISKEQFGLWKHEPVTMLVFEFLKAKHDFLKNSALDEWVSGRPWPETVRGQIIELDNVINLERSEILAFYGIEEQEDDGTEPKSYKR